jgi:signal transduction histidine kinase
MSSKWNYVLDEPACILLADDDPILREFASVYLATPTTTIETVPDGAAALAALKAGRYDLAIIDVQMPQIDGFTLVEHIRDDRELADLPIIILTGHEDVASVDRAYQVGANSFATKPVNWRQISYQIRYVLRAAHMELELREAKRLSEESSRVKSQLLLLMSHELRTPLNAITGFADMLHRELKAVPGAAPCTEYADLIAAAGQGLLERFVDILSYADLLLAQNELREDEYRLALLMEQAGRAVAADADRVGAQVAMHAAPAGLRITCDGALLVRLLRHLLHNAIVHSGAASVEFGAEPSADGGIRLWVRDHGPGLEPAQRVAPDLFDPSRFSLTRNAVGFGVGLPLAHEIAAAHGGRLAFDDGPEGFTVSVAIPASRVAAMSAAPSIAEAPHRSVA